MVRIVTLPRAAILTAVTALVMALMGCGETTLFGKANPRWEFRTPTGAHAMSSKDDDFEMEGFEMQKPDGTVVAKISKLKVTGNASGPRKADVDQTLALVQQQLAFNEGITRMFAGVGQAASIVLGGMTDLASVRAAKSSCSGNTVALDYLNKLEENIQQRMNLAVTSLQQGLLTTASTQVGSGQAAIDKITAHLAALEAKIDELKESKSEVPATEPSE